MHDHGSYRSVFTGCLTQLQDLIVCTGCLTLLLSTHIDDEGFHFVGTIPTIRDIEVLVYLSLTHL